jgi:hypothetical protein
MNCKESKHNAKWNSIRSGADYPSLIVEGFKDASNRYAFVLNGEPVPGAWEGVYLRFDMHDGHDVVMEFSSDNAARRAAKTFDYD